MRCDESIFLDFTPSILSSKRCLLSNLSLSLLLILTCAFQVSVVESVEPSQLQSKHRAIEEIIELSGVAFRFLRVGLVLQTFLYLPVIREQGGCTAILALISSSLFLSLSHPALIRSLLAAQSTHQHSLDRRTGAGPCGGLLLHAGRAACRRAHHSHCHRVV